MVTEDQNARDRCGDGGTAVREFDDLPVFGSFADKAKSGLAGILAGLYGPVRSEDVLCEGCLLGRRGIGREWHLADGAAASPL